MLQTAADTNAPIETILNVYLNDRPKGEAYRFRVGCLLTFAQIVMPTLRAKFERAYPEVRFRQFERNQGQLLEMLQRGEIDAALTYDLELSQDTTFEPLMLVPAYVISELKASFQIGAVLFLPFLVIDLMVASVTLAVGMVQLPPVMVSAPFKIRGADIQVRGPAPTAGEHTWEVLEQGGFSEDEIAELAANGVLG